MMWNKKTNQVAKCRGQEAQEHRWWSQEGSQTTKTIPDSCPSHRGCRWRRGGAGRTRDIETMVFGTAASHHCFVLDSLKLQLNFIIPGVALWMTCFLFRTMWSNQSKSEDEERMRSLCDFVPRYKLLIYELLIWLNCYNCSNSYV